MYLVPLNKILFWQCEAQIYIYSCRGLSYINVIINYFLPIFQDTFKQWVSIFFQGIMSKPFYDYDCTCHVIYTATLNSRVVSSHTASGTFYRVNHFHLHIIQSTTLIQLKRPTTTVAGGKAKKKRVLSLKMPPPKKATTSDLGPK